MLVIKPSKAHICSALLWTSEVRSNNVSCPATVSSQEGTNQNQDHVSFTHRVSCKEVGLSLQREGGVKKRWLIKGLQCVSFGVCMHTCICACERGEWGLASKRQGNEWSHSVCGPLASAVERRGAWAEYREMLFLPLMALLVMDETAPTSFWGSPAMHLIWDASSQMTCFFTTNKVKGRIWCFYPWHENKRKC